MSNSIDSWKLADGKIYHGANRHPRQGGPARTPLQLGQRGKRPTPAPRVAVQIDDRDLLKKSVPSNFGGTALALIS